MPEVFDVFPRAWVEFVDPGDDQQSIRADLTWLTSRWTCIYGRGCQGIDAAVPAAGCCSHGAHFADRADEQRVGQWVQVLTPQQWQQHPGTRRIRKRDWIETDDEGARKTLVSEGACVFQNAPSFAAGAGCALHVLAVERGESHVATKPDVCWQLPLRRDFTWVERADGEQRLVITITEYVRGMWGDGGHDFDWYCTSNSEAHIGQEPVYRSSRAELVALLGEAAYEALVRHCRAHEAARSALALTPVGPGGLAPHPATQLADPAG